MKLLTIDIECAPMLVHAWGTRDQNIGLPQIIEQPRVLSFAAKWFDKPKVEFRSEFHDSRETMIERAHALLDEADAIVHYNGTTFDVPWLHTEIAGAGLTPPSPHKNIDLLKVARKNFRLPSYKLQYVSTFFGLEGKVAHTGHQLWVDCLNGDPKAWGLMRKYNIGDTRLTEELYVKLRPWIGGHPHHALYETGEGVECCSRCGSEHLERRGYTYTALSKYPRFRCKDCGSWSRGKRAVATVDVRGIS